MKRPIGTWIVLVLTAYWAFSAGYSLIKLWTFQGAFENKVYSETQVSTCLMLQLFISVGLLVSLFQMRKLAVVFAGAMVILTAYLLYYSLDSAALGRAISSQMYYLYFGYVIGAFGVPLAVSCYIFLLYHRQKLT